MTSSFQTRLTSRLQPPYLRLLAIAVVLMGIVLAVICYATSDQGTSTVGIPWGADFAGFYVAGQILDEAGPAQHYDRELHAQFYHRLLPKLPKDEVIPYVHPPFVAGTLKLLTKLSYDIAVVVWMVITLVLYVMGTLVVLQTCPLLDRQHRWLVVLLTLSFEPFLFECWLGGQLSAVGYFSFALCYYFIKRGKPLLAGVALGLCFYKPTLLLLMLPMLLAGRQWLMLGGMTLTGFALLGLSLLMTGWECTLGYIDVLLAFRRESGGAEAFVIRDWKYVDVNHFWQMLTGHTIGKQASLGIISIALLTPVIGWYWWRNCGLPSDRLWAATLLMVPVVNFYFGIYDTVLVVQASIIMTEAILHRNGNKLLTTRWPWLLMLLAIVPWFSSPVAKGIGAQLYTLVMIAGAWYAMPKSAPTQTVTSD